MSNNRLLVSLFLVLGAHGVLLMVPLSKQKTPIPLKVTLLPSPIQPVERQAEPEQVARAVEPLADTAAFIPDKAPVPVSKLEEPPIPPSSKVQRLSDIVQQTRHAMSQPRFHSFSLQDHVPQQAPSFERAPSHIQLAARRPNRSSQNVGGQSTDLVRNRRGESACWQQRGIPGETQQWYRVPLSLCGHLE